MAKGMVEVPMRETRPRKWIVTTAVLGLFTLAAFAGCMGGTQSEDKAGNNKAPVADLKATKKSGWTGETYTFDPRGSKDSDGEVVTYKFDFGDGTTMEKDAKTTDREVEHIYLSGGEYTVTLTVTDDGGKDSGALTSTDAEKVAVNFRKTIEPQVIYAGPAGVSTPAKLSQEFQVKKEADRIESDIHLRSGLVTGSSQFEIELKDSANSTVGEKKTATVNPGQNVTVSITGTPTREGSYHLYVTPTTGGGTVDGEIRIYYDADI
jgi:PKD repeat protein